MARLSVPSTGRLISTIRVSNSTSLARRLIYRLSRHALVDLALVWLDEQNQATCAPLLDSSDDDPNEVYPLAVSLERLRQLYRGLESRKGSKREVADRILHGDWRHGLSLYQLAMADVQYLHEHPTSQRWVSYRILPVEPCQAKEEATSANVDNESLAVPRLHPSTFLRNLQDQVLPDVKVHYHLHRPSRLGLLLVRVFLIDSPYGNHLASDSGASRDLALLDAARTLYIMFPDGAPFVYLSKLQGSSTSIDGTDAKILHDLVTESIPKALSQPRRRFTLQHTNVQSKNIEALLNVNGAGRTNEAGGGWGVYADKKKESPLESLLPTGGSPSPEHPDEGQKGTKRQAGRLAKEGGQVDDRMLSVRARFGNNPPMINNGKGFERVDVVLEDPFQGPLKDTADEDSPSDPSSWVPSIKMGFRGSHVFAGMQQLAEAGVLETCRIPAWITGEENINLGVVRRGRIQGLQRDVH